MEVADRDELIALGCGGIVAVNGGSDEPPRMITMAYRPDGATAHLALVGKGIMYDSGGISLKPSDASHASMKMDISGAAAVLSSMSTLSALNCPNEVVGFMMCTDNMPSGSATKKSARAIPSHEEATNAASASSRDRSICAESRPGGGTTSCEPPSSYFDE